MASALCYTRGSIYDSVVGPAHLLIAVTIVMTGALLMGLLRRKRRAIANIGFEGVIILALYAGSLVYLFRS